MQQNKSDKPIRVLLWAPRGSSELYSGPGSFVYRLYSTDDRNRFRITLAHSRDDQPRRDLFEAQHSMGSTGSSWQTWRTINRGAKWARQHAGEFDIFHGLGAFHATVLAAWNAERAGLPAVVFVANHRAELVDHKSLLKRIAGLPAKRRAMVRDLSCLIAMSDAIEEELLEYGVEPGRIARIPMGVNVERFRPAADDDERAAARAQMGWPERLTVVFSGAMVRRKQPHLLIEAIARSAAEGVDAQVALVGPPQDEDYVAEMRQRAQELGAADRVIWAGFTETPEIANRAADVFSLPSLKEGMSAALVEAMACGLPCVVTPVSGSGDLIDDGVNGRIVPAEVEPVVEALLGYLQDASVRRTHGQRARQVVEQRYSHVAVLNAYEQLFRRLLRGQPAAAEADSR